MKRFIAKFIQMLVIFAVPLVMAGCSMPFGGGDEDEFATLDVNAENSNLPAPKDGKDAQANDENQQKSDTAEDTVISLSNNYSTFSIDSDGRTTPFVPYRERNLTYSTLKFGDLPLPPSVGEIDDVINNLVSAKVTGILFDQGNPSAILNVEGDDYLVKPGDEIDGFKIASITKDYVAVQTGTNIYRAKVGDIVDGEIYDSGIYNVGHKFAGVRKPAKADDVLIFGTKKQNPEGSKKEEGFNEMTLPPVPEILTSGNAIKIKTKSGDIPLPLGGNKSN